MDVVVPLLAAQLFFFAKILVIDENIPKILLQFSYKRKASMRHCFSSNQAVATFVVGKEDA